MTASKIEWTDVVWNPVRGCSKVSAGCAHCYAERQGARFSKPLQRLPNDEYEGGEPFAGFVRDGKWTGLVGVVPDALDKPLRWRKPKRVFVNSMSDLFHEALPDEAIDRVFAMMAFAPQHTFQVLTKRPERMQEYMRRGPRDLADGRRGYIDSINRASMGMLGLPVFPTQALGMVPGAPWPLPNVWLGVSVEDQVSADARIPLLLDTPAAVRWVSYEPALGPVDFERVKVGCGAWSTDCCCSAFGGARPCALHRRLDWIVVGGESGPGARPCDVAWIRSALDECKAAQVPCFVKQLGANAIDHAPRGTHRHHWLARVRHPKAGDPSEWPEDLRVRDFPRAHP